MGLVSAILRSRQPEMILLMVGFDNAGKTTILYHLKNGERLYTAPTGGINMQTIYVKGTQMTIWDLGGRPAIRKYWKTHYGGKSGISKESKEHKKQFRELMGERTLDGLPLLVYANKSDKEKRMPIAEIVKELGLQNIDRKWHVQPTDALAGNGAEEGILWMKAAIEGEYEALPYFVKKWRWLGDIKSNLTDIKSNISKRISKYFSFFRGGQATNQYKQLLKTYSIKEQLNRTELSNYIELLKDRRGQLFEQFKREYAIMRDSPGELSKKDSEELCKKIDQEMHELFEEIEGAQRKLDALV